MTLRVAVAQIAPDLRFALRTAMTRPGVEVPVCDLMVRAEGSLPPGLPVGTYLRYADQETVITAEGAGTHRELQDRLAAHIRTAAETDLDGGLSAAVLALDAVDWCFRHSGLWRGNIYLAGGRSLTEVLHLVDDRLVPDRVDRTAARELAALELAYLFPIAARFRRGVYDGQVQFRLNGWGRSLAARLATAELATTRAVTYRRLLGAHLAAEFRQYKSFLDLLDLTRQGYQSDLLEQAMSLPIPVLV